MSDESERFPLLVLLVGANPLPNYLAACALRPKRVVLLYSPQTVNAKAQLRAVLADPERGLLPEGAVGEAEVANASSAVDVRDTLGRVLPRDRATVAQSVWLNYTGGTKVMAVHACAAFIAHGGLPQHASYLDERGLDSSRAGTARVGQAPRLYFDEAPSKALSEYKNLRLDLDTILRLHAIETRPRGFHELGPKPSDAEVILRAVLADLDLAGRLFKERERLEGLQVQSALEAPFVPADTPFGLRLSAEGVPSPDICAEAKRSDAAKKRAKNAAKRGLTRASVDTAATANPYSAWYRFLGGEWLEEWVAAQMRQLFPQAEITTGIEVPAATGSDSRFEVDVAMVRGHRSYFLSCTTGGLGRKEMGLCKNKAFEITLRGRQLGGDLARAGLVCLANDGRVAKLREAMREFWDSSTETRIFGLSDVRSWAGTEHVPADLGSLKAWLES